MSPTPLEHQHVEACLRGDTPSITVENVLDVHQSIQYYQQRLSETTAALHAATTKARFLKFLSRSSRGKTHQRLLEELRDSERKYKTMIVALQSLLSPIRRLPTELLTEIFIHCLPCTQFIQPDAREAPLLLMQVCTWWRRVCISSSQLWTSLELVTKISEATQPDQTRHTTNAESLLRLWLSRSGDWPLSISIQNDSLLIKDAQYALDNCARRLQHLKVTIPKKTHPSILPNNQYPLLESFELYTPCGLTDALIKDLSTAMMRSPLLHRFIWTNTSYLSSHINLQWSNLTHLQLITTIALEQCLAILSKATNATYLDFKDIFLDREYPPYREIVLPKLTTFIISSRANIAEIFERLTLPKLKVFMITIPTWPHSSLIGFFRRSQFPLENLDIFFPHIFDTDLIECLDIVQNTLTELTIQGEGRTVTDPFLDQLTVSGEGSVFCSKLESVAFYRCVSCSPGGLGRMVQSRIKAPSESPDPHVARLQTIEVFQSEVELFSLKPLRKSGLRLIVYSEEDGSTIDLDMEGGDLVLT